MHGWGGNKNSFDSVFFTLPYRTVALDLWGFGESDPPDEAGWSTADYADAVAEFLRRLDLTGVDVVAHSFGARVAIQLAVRHPQAVNKLLLTGAAGLKPAFSLKKKLRVLQYKTAKRLQRVFPVSTDRFGSRDYRALTPQLRQTFLLAVNEDLSLLAKKIGCETLLYWGKEDAETPLSMGKRLHRLIADSTLICVSGGHFAYLNRSFGSVVRNFFGGVV